MFSNPQVTKIIVVGYNTSYNSSTYKVSDQFSAQN